MVKDIPETAEVKIQFFRDLDPFATTHFSEPSRPPFFTIDTDRPLCEQLPSIHRTVRAPHAIANCGLYLTDENQKDPQKANCWLDLELSLAENLADNGDEQSFENKKYKITLKTALPVKVHNVITKLYNTTGRDLRRSLFSLNKVFDDFDFITQFCANENGLNCLLKIGSGEHKSSYNGPDNNFQNYILRAYQAMIIYVDGMEAISGHVETIRWLYSLITSDFKILAKQSLKLLNEFCSYRDENLQTFLECIQYVDGVCPWWNMLQALGSQESQGSGIDHEVVLHALKILNMTLAVIENWVGLGENQ